MNFKQRLITYVLIFAIGYVVGVIVTFLYSLIVHGEGLVNWQTAFYIAFILALALTGWREEREKK